MSKQSKPASIASCIRRPTVATSSPKTFTADATTTPGNRSGAPRPLRAALRAATRAVRKATGDKGRLILAPSIMRVTSQTSPQTQTLGRFVRILSSHATARSEERRVGKEEETGPHNER